MRRLEDCELKAAIAEMQKVAEEDRKAVDTSKYEMTEYAYSLAQLRHLYWLMKRGFIKDMSEAADGLLAPAIETLEKVDK